MYNAKTSQVRLPFRWFRYPHELCDETPHILCRVSVLASFRFLFKGRGRLGYGSALYAEMQSESSLGVVLSAGTQSPKSLLRRFSQKKIRIHCVDVLERISMKHSTVLRDDSVGHRIAAMLSMASFHDLALPQMGLHRLCRWAAAAETSEKCSIR